MKLKSLIIVILFTVWLLQGCKNDSSDKVSIQGTFSNIPGTKLYVFQVLPGSKVLIDSANTDVSGDFTISFKVQKEGFYALGHNSDNEITLVVSPGEKISITGNGNSLRDTYTIEGSKDSRLYADYNKFRASNLKKVDSLSKVFAESRSNADFVFIKKRLDSAYLAIFDDQKEKVISFINSHLNSLSSLLVISESFGPNPVLSEQTHPELFLKLDSTLFLAYPENSLVSSFHKQMLDFKAELADAKEHDKNFKPGMPAPEISLSNSSGTEIKLSSLHGKLTLVYFWSSWNALCRQTNMNLTGIYTKYHNRGFEIYAVSIDSDADLWKKAYLLDKAYWIQVNDPKGLESDYSKTYAVMALPKMILVGRDGNIIARNPVLSELDALIKKNL